MRLFDCKFVEGRAEGAPKLRTEQRGKSELKDADEGELHMILPHSTVGDELEKMYPRAEVIDDDYESFDESLMHQQDYLGWYGAQLGEAIMASAVIHGRRRHLPHDGEWELE